MRRDSGCLYLPKDSEYQASLKQHLLRPFAPEHYDALELWQDYPKSFPSVFVGHPGSANWHQAAQEALLNVAVCTTELSVHSPPSVSSLHRAVVGGIPSFREKASLEF